MDILLKILPIILYFLLSILVVVLIILSVRTIRTLNKVDTTIDDVNNKMGKLNGLFNLVDRSTDVINLFTEKIVSTVTSGIVSIFKKKKEKGGRRGERVKEEFLSF